MAADRVGEWRVSEGTIKNHFADTRKCEINSPGVYVLLGEDDNVSDCLYVGEADMEGRGWRDLEGTPGPRSRAVDVTHAPASRGIHASADAWIPRSRVGRSLWVAVGGCR